jgi:hypothetical protein
VDEIATGHASDPLRLRGLLCWNGGEAELAVRGGVADFLVLRNRLPAPELGSICRSVDVPVYAHGIGLDDAWSLGATGIGDF